MSSNFTFTHTQQQHVRRQRLTTNDSVFACVRCISLTEMFTVKLIKIDDINSRLVWLIVDRSA